MSKLMKIGPVGAELFRTDGQTDITQLIVAFHYFMKAPKNETQNKIAAGSNNNNNNNIRHILAQQPQIFPSELNNSTPLLMHGLSQ
jgi:hypothetical protein